MTVTAQSVVSVVIPVYGVEDYITECIGSVLDQTYPHLEVIVIDDGSPDRSIDLVRERAAGDPRVTVTAVPNGGLGAARNLGASLATGDLLCFVDSDDVLPSDAIATLVDSLARTGSQVALGNVHRIVGDTQPPSRLHRRVLTRRREGVRLVDVPALVNATTSCNAMFVRSFWVEHELTFPVGAYYEDLATMARALSLATGIDTTGTVTYLWRMREDGSSISQQRTDPRILADRLAALRACAEVYAPLGPAVTHALLAKILTFDLPVYLTATAAGGPEVRALLASAVEEYWARGTAEVPEVLADLGVRDRIRYHLVREGRWADLEPADEWLRENREMFPWRRTWRGALLLDVPHLPALAKLPHEVLDIRPDLRLRVDATEAVWDDAALHLSVQGTLRLRHVTTTDVRAEATLTRGAKTTTLPVELTAPGAEPGAAADARTFSLTVPYDQARRDLGAGNALLTVTASIKGLSRTEPVRGPADLAGAASDEDAGTTHPSAGISVVSQPRRPLKIKVGRAAHATSD